MLTSLREGAKSGFLKFILFGFLVLAVAGLVLTDVGGFFSGGPQRDTVARIADKNLSTQEFDNTVRRILSRQGLDPQTAYQLGVIDQIMQGEVTDTLIRRSAYEMGILIGDDMVLEQINRILEPFVLESGETRSDTLRRLLRAQNMSEQAFIQAIRSEMTNTMIRNSLQLSTAFTPDAEAFDLYQHSHEERALDLIVLPNADITDLPASGDEVLRPIYDISIERYAIPETRRFTMAVLTQDTLADMIDVPEDELRRIYQRDIATYTMGERRVMQQAILDDSAAAEEIAAQARDGAALEQAVQDVTGSAEYYMGEQAFERDGLIEDIATRAFDAQPGDVIGPVRTPLGWHVLYLSAINPPETRPFEDVKDSLRREILDYRLMDEMFAYANSVDDMLAGGADLENVAADMELETVTIGPVRDDGSTPDNSEGMGAYQDSKDSILELAFEMREGESSPVIELASGEYIALRVDDIAPHSYQPFDEVKDDIRRIWERDQRDVLNRQRAQDILRALLGGDTTLAEAAADQGADVRQLTMTRADSPPAPLTRAAKDRLFETREDDYNLAAIENGYVIGHVRTVTLPAPDTAEAEELADIRSNTATEMQNEALSAYYGYLRSQYRVRINNNVLTSMYGPGGEFTY